MIEEILLNVTRITSFWFFIFIALAVLIYYSVPIKARWTVLLLAGSIYFVLACSWKLYVIFAVQVFLAWGGVLLAKRYVTRQKQIYIAAVIVQVGLLVMLKENSFFIINARLLTGKEIPFLDWAAPLGMSYYTLMLVSYILDCAWGTSIPQKNPLKLCLYSGFFPQMISGPFTRYNEMAGQLYEGHKFHLEQIQFGLQRFMWGLFKKLVIAERSAVIVNTIYNGGTIEQMGTVTFKGVYIVIGAFAYVIQVYTDFSGCMDMVIGMAQMFGIKLPENFNTPFYSTSLSEFWRRWHITLGGWARDYVMYPFLKSKAAVKLRGFCKAKFGKKAAKEYPAYLGTLLVWLTIGFWHGGTYKWLFWGISTFVIIVGGMILQPLFSWMTKLFRINTEAASWTLFQRIRTTCLFALTGSVQPAFRLSEALGMWRRVFTYNPWVLVDGSLYRLGLDRLDFWVMVFALMVLFVVSKYQQEGSVREKVAKQNLVFRWILWLGLLAAVLLFGMYGEGYNPADFIYGGF